MLTKRGHLNFSFENLIDRFKTLQHKNYFQSIIPGLSRDS